MTDLSSLVPVTKRRVPKGPSRVVYSLKRNTSEKRGTFFTMSSELFERIGLGDKSMTQSKDPNGDGVFIQVHPGNDGDFMKNSERGKKGKTFKRDDLHNALNDEGLTGEFFDLSPLGELDGVSYYRVVAVEADAPLSIASNDVFADNNTEPEAEETDEPAPEEEETVPADQDEL